MSDHGALVCVLGEDRSPRPRAAEAPRWRRRGHVAPPVMPAPLASRPPPPRSASGGHLLRTGLWVALLASVAAGALTVARAHLGDSASSGHIGAGCEEVGACRALEAEAQRRLEQCWLLCGSAAAEHRTARLMRYRSEERQAVREHYRERELAERLEQQNERARQQDEWQRRETARAQEAAREHQRRLELERARQVYIDRRLAEQRQRRAGYYAALGKQGRAQRLKRCLADSPSCDALVLDLLDATRDDAERRLLAELNEGVTHALPAPVADPSQRDGKAGPARAADDGVPAAVDVELEAPAPEADEATVTGGAPTS